MRYYIYFLERLSHSLECRSRGQALLRYEHAFFLAFMPFKNYFTNNQLTKGMAK